MTENCRLRDQRIACRGNLVFHGAIAYNADTGEKLWKPDAVGRGVTPSADFSARANATIRMFRSLWSRLRSATPRPEGAVELRRGRSDPGSAPCYTQPRSPSQTPPPSRQMHRLPRE